MYLVASHLGEEGYAEIVHRGPGADRLLHREARAFAQSSDYSDGAGGGEAPTLVMPGLLTSPITSGLDSDGYGATGNDGADRDDRRTCRGPLFGRGRRATGT